MRKLIYIALSITTWPLLIVGALVCIGAATFAKFLIDGSDATIDTFESFDRQLDRARAWAGIEAADAS